MLGSGVAGLLTGDRRPNRLSFCLQEAIPRIKLSIRLLVRAGGRVELRVLGVLVVLGGWVDLRLSARSVGSPYVRICVHLCDLWAVWVGGWNS